MPGPRACRVGSNTPRAEPKRKQHICDCRAANVERAIAASAGPPVKVELAQAPTQHARKPLPLVPTASHRPANSPARTQRDAPGAARSQHALRQQRAGAAALPQVAGGPRRPAARRDPQVGPAADATARTHQAPATSHLHLQPPPRPGPPPGGGRRRRRRPPRPARRRSWSCASPACATTGRRRTSTARSSSRTPSRGRA
jgi:hypothetical protein